MVGRQQPRRRPALIRDQNSGQTATRRHRPDYWLVIIAMILMTIGIVVVYSISPGLAASRGVSENYFISKQLIAVGLGVISFLAAAFIPVNWWRKTIPALLVITLIACVIALVTPLDEVYRAHRWIRFSGLSFQVAELIKFTLLIWLAVFLAKQWQRGMLGDFKATLRPLLGVIVGIGLVVAGLQSDFGSAVVLVAMVVLMAFVSGVPMRRLLLVGSIVVAIMLVAILSSSYRRDRVFTFLNPQRDCQNAGYQACQALIAVGSGGLTGLGLGHSVQAYGYLPEASNDSIFAIMSEKFGFAGMSVIVGLIALLLSRMKRIIEHTSDQTNRLIVTGVLAWISTQAIINIGAMLGLLPLKGITLPFISYGGTSLLFVTAALGLVFQISRYTNYSAVEPQANNNETETPYRRDGRGVRGSYNPDLVSRPRT